MKTTNYLTLFYALLLTATVAFSQNTQVQQNSANTLLNNAEGVGVTLGGYAQIDYNEYDGSKPGKLDVHRMILLFGYKFNDKVSFVTELEIEHVSEVYVEQAFLSYKASPSVNVVAGLMLVPMGIINEYHEPTTYYGVERPNVDNVIVPTTWRELGFGINGNLTNASLRYQAYIFNGFKSYANGSGLLKGSNGLRSGRQKGAESIINSPNLSLKLDYYGLPGLRLGLSGYFGKTQTDDVAIEGSTIGLSMIGLDARYSKNNWDLRTQYITAKLSDTEAYNILTGKDLGAAMNGFYAEAAYNFNLKGEEKLAPFIRYEKYNTHADTAGNLVQNKAYDIDEVIFGVSYKVAPGAVFKADYQLVNNAVQGSNTGKTFNAGVGIWF